MKLTNLLLILFLFLTSFCLSQVLITTSNYSQDFGTSTISLWTDNSTYTGWYLTAGGTFSYYSTFNVTTTSNSIAAFNNGGFYTYECNNDDNIKLGSRPSNASGGSSGTGQSHIGLRFINNTGQTIESITIIYNGYQLSLAENGTGNTNKLTFSYRISATANTSLITGSWTNVTSLDYSAPNNSSTAGSLQVQGYPCTISQNLSQCINIPSLANGSEIMLRWSDLNNTNNDHHLAIDNIQVLFHFDNACAITLPIELLEFSGNEYDNDNLLQWSTASERDNDYFALEKSSDGINWIELSKISGAGNSTEQKNYQALDYSVDKIVNYYRLKQVDFNGEFNYIDIISIDNRVKNEYVIRRINLLGQEINDDVNGLIIEVYSDGTSKKIVK